MISVAANRIHSPCHANHIQRKQKGGGIKKESRKGRKKEEGIQSLGWDAFFCYMFSMQYHTINCSIA